MHDNMLQTPEGMAAPPQLSTGGEMFIVRSNMLLPNEPLPHHSWDRLRHAIDLVTAWNRRGVSRDLDGLVQFDYERDEPDVDRDNLSWLFAIFRAWLPHARIVGYRMPEKRESNEIWSAARDWLATQPPPVGPNLCDCHLYLGDLIGDNPKRVERVVNSAIERTRNGAAGKPIVCQAWFQTTGRRSGTWLDAPTVRYLCERVHEAHKRGEFNTDEVYFTVSGGAGAYTDSPNEFNDWINEIAADVGEVFAETA